MNAEANDDRPVFSLERSHPKGSTVWGEATAQFCIPRRSEQPITRTVLAHSSKINTQSDCAHSGIFRVSVSNDVREESFGRCEGTDSLDSSSACKLDDARIICDLMQDRLSDGHLEAGRSVPCLHRRSNSTALLYRNQRMCDVDSIGMQSPRRSVSDGLAWRWLHCLSAACVCVRMCDQQCMCSDIGASAHECETEWHAGLYAPIPAQAR